MNSSGGITGSVVSSCHGVFSFNTICPVALHCARPTRMVLPRLDPMRRATGIEVELMKPSLFVGCQPAHSDIGDNLGMEFKDLYAHIRRALAST